MKTWSVETNRRWGRRPLAAMAALLVVLVLATPAVATDVITEGDMEDPGTPNWPHTDLVGTNSSNENATDQVSTGTYSLRGTSATGRKVDVGWYNSQAIGTTIEDTDTVLLSLWWGARFNVSSQTASGDLFVDVKLSGDSWSQAINLWTVSITPSTSFQSAAETDVDVSSQFTVPGATYDFRLRFEGSTGNDNAANIEIWWDDVVLDVTAGANTTPTASAGDISGQDDPQYAGVQYQVTAVYSDADGSTDLASLFLALDRDGSGPPSAPDDIILSTSQGAAASGSTTVGAGGAFLIGTPTYSKTEGSPTANDITVTWTYTLDWDWFDDSTPLAEYAVRATDDQAADSGWDLTNIDIDYENDLDLSGTLAVSGAVNGAVTCGATWAQGSETLTWSGLTVVYEGSGVSPVDGDFDIQITDDDTGSWTQTTGAALSLATTTDLATDVSDVHNVDIINIPAGGSDVSATTCVIQVDADAPETLAGAAAGSPTSSSITVSWTAFGGGDTGAVGDSGFQSYRVYYDTNPGVTTADPFWDSSDDAALASSATSSTVVGGLSSSTPYYFRVVGLDQAENLGSVPAASEVTETTSAGANNTPTASAGDISGQDDPQYAGIQYQVTAIYADADGASDLADVYLRLDHDTATDIELSVAQGAAGAGNATVVSGAAFLIGTPTFSKTEGTPTANDITVTWTYTLDWDWVESTLIEYGVRAVDDQAADSGFSNTNIDIRYENDLDYSGTLSVNGAVNGAITCGSDWVRGTEALTWSGLTVVYEGGGTSPADGDFDIRITDDDTGSWTQLTSAVLNLGTTSDNATDPSDVHNVDIINVPAGGSDVSTVSCEIKVDADLPETLGGVAAGSPTTSSITVSWTAYGGGDTGAVGDSGFQTYRVYYDTSPGVTTADPVWDAGDDAALASSATSLTVITGLAPNTPYYFRVVGRDQAENEGSGPGASEVSDTTQPAAGDILTASDNTPIRALDPAAGEPGLVMQRIRLDSDTTGDGSIELISVSLEDVGTAQTVDVATVTVYLGADLVFAGAVQVGSATFNTNPVTVTLDGGTAADRTVTNPSPKYLWVVYDLAGGAVAGRTIQSRVTDVEVAGPDTPVAGLAFDSNLLTIIGAVANETTVSGSTAYVSACSPLSPTDPTGQITVVSRFTGDDDDDGSVLVRWDNDASPADGTVACAAGTGPSPRQCLVTGLAPSSEVGNYWIYVAFADADGVGGTDPQTLGGGTGFVVADCAGADTAAPTALILSPWRGAIIGGTERIKVQVWDAGGALAASALEWAVDAGTLVNTGVSVNSSYDCGTDCGIFEFDLDTTTVNGGLTDDSHRLVIQVTDGASHVARVEQAFRVRNLGTTPGGSGQLLRRTPGSQLCADCHDILSIQTHSSQTTSTDYGNWAMACNDCHTPHGTTNVNLLRQEIRTPNSGKVEVRFEVKTQAVADSSAPGTASYVNQDADTDPGTAPAHGPCQACHTRTQSSDATPQARWRNTTAGGNADSHYTNGSNQVCSTCHQHTGGFSGAGGGGCDGCHFGSGRVADARRDIAQDFSDAATRSHHVGAGGTYMGGTLTNFDCVVCHAEGTIEAGETATTDYHNDTGTKANCSAATSPKPCIDLKDVDNWNDADPNNSPVFRYDKQLLVENLSGGTPGATPGNWSSTDADWRTETSNRLDPFCLTCHDFDGATASRNADTTTDTCATPDALNPFCDLAITNEYDQYDRGRVTDIASRATNAWRTGPSGSYTATDRDISGEARYDEAPTGPDGIADPPLGVYSRHAIRGVAVTGGFSGAASVYASATDANGDIPANRWTSTTWEDNSVMGCADCHTVDGANHESGNAHGSDASEYLLKDANGAATLGSRAAGTYNCWRCHAAGYYDFGATLNHTDNASDWAETVGTDGAARVSNDGNIFGMACTNCHGGVEGGTQASPGSIQFGTIHGTSQSYGIGNSGVSGTRLAYRFMNGNSLRYYDPNGWSGNVTVSCYTIDSGEADSFGACSQHDRNAKTWDKPVDRDLKY